MATNPSHPEAVIPPGSELPPDSSPDPLSTADWERFTAALDNPPQANEALTKAMRRRKPQLRSKPNAG